ncbi:hypothetical protein Peur_004800 [Populus x canadensis]
MVRTRQGTQTEPPSLERRGMNRGAQGWQDEDLDDTASHAPIIPPETLQGEDTMAGEGPRPHQTEGTPSVAMEQRERPEAQPSTVPTGVPPQYVDAGLLVQIVKAVMEGMANSVAQTTPTTQNPPAAPTTSMTMDNVVPLVRLVKSMREMGCEPYMGEQDAEIAGRWIRKVEKTMIQISIPEGLRVNCASQLLSDRAMTWWETVQLRRATETLTWSDFKTEFENQFYSKYHRKVKEQEFLALRQGDMSVLEYERRFHDLSLFAPHYFPLGDALCAEERVIGGGTASILAKGVITVVGKVITRGTAPKGTPDKYRAIDSPVRATSSQSPLIGQ